MASNSIGKEPECWDSIIDIPQNLPPTYWPECCIYRVPKLLRKVKEEAYTPKLVSIGPFHHGQEELKDMEIHKRRYFEDFLKRTERSQEELLKIIQDNKDEICRCYSGTFDQKYCSKDQFENMILLDAIFIIELFLKYRDKDVKEADQEAERKRKEAESKKTNCLLSLLPSRKAEKKAEEEREAEAETTNCLRSLPPSLKEEEKAEEEKSKEEKAKEKKAENEKYYILHKPWLDIGIYHDLILLENQLPFFVLEKLYMFAFNIDSSRCNHREESKREDEHEKDLEKEDAPFVILSRNYFKGYDNQPLSIKIGNEVKHFTDFIRYLFCSVKYTREKSTGDLDHLYCATKLDDAGLQFKAVEKRRLFDDAELKFKADEKRRLLDDTGLKFKADEMRRLLDVKFPENECLKYFPCLNLSWLLACLPCSKCCPCLEGMERSLEVPRFEIVDSTETLFRNLMALEQCCYPFDAYICNYVKLLDYLIDTEKDVDLLVDKKVIANKIGSNKEVATLINELCFQIPDVNSCYAGLGKEITEYRDNPWNSNMATLKSTYCSDIWRGSTTAVGLIVLGFTLWGFLRLYL